MLCLAEARESDELSGAVLPCVIIYETGAEVAGYSYTIANG